MAAEIEITISVKRHYRERHHFDPTLLDGKRFWNRRLDSIVIDTNYQTLYTLKFERSSYKNEQLLKKGEGGEKLE